jgi:hypothetical protein
VKPPAPPTASQLRLLVLLTAGCCIVWQQDGRPSDARENMNSDRCRFPETAWWRFSGQGDALRPTIHLASLRVLHERRWIKLQAADNLQEWKISDAGLLAIPADMFNRRSLLAVIRTGKLPPG